VSPVKPQRPFDEEERLTTQSQLAVTTMNYLITLDQALRLYDLGNSMVVGTLGDLVEISRRFYQTVGEALSLAVVQNTWFACRRLVRLSYNDYKKAEQLRAIWNGLQVGEMIFPPELDHAGIRAFATHLKKGTTTAETAGQSWGGVVVIAPLSGSEGMGQLDRRPEFLVKAYCALVVLIGAVLEALRTGERPPLLRIRRILQVLADGCQDHEPLLLGLATRLGARRGAQAQAAHLANVAVYAVIIARHLRLPRHHVLSLATAALYHDLPKLGLPEATLSALERPEELGPDEKEQVRQRWRNAIIGLLQAVGASEELLPRLVVIHESLFEFTAPGPLLYPQRPEAGLSLFSKVVAAANALEICGHARDGSAQSPHVAMSGVVHGYRQLVGDPITLSLLQAAGWYPPGAAVLLENGEVGVVIAPDSRGERPRLRMVRTATGEPLDGSGEVDLGVDNTRNAVWSLHPSRLGINPIPCLLPRAPAY
jgi:hypothetical protein